METTVRPTAGSARKLAAYRYLATNPQGKLVKGSLRASNSINAEQILYERGLTPISVESAPSFLTIEEALPSLFRIKPQDVIIFSRQLATLLKSGVSLLPSLEILSEQVPAGRVFRKILRAIVNDIRSGGALSDAIAKHPAVFVELYCKTISIGEQTGNLENALNQMADYLEKQDATNQQIRKALSYPIILALTGFVVVIILMTVVIPSLSSLFNSLQLDLPLPTRILIAASTFITEHYLLIILAVVALGAGAAWLARQHAGRRIIDRFMITAPLLGPAILLNELARFARTMSLLINAGLSLQDIMELAPHTTSNSVIRDALEEVHTRLILGEGLSEPMSHISLFPPLLVQMVTVGEESNTLGFTMSTIADFYQTTSEERISSLVSLIGPLSTIVIALIVGFIAISVLLPMYSIAGNFG